MGRFSKCLEIDALSLRSDLQVKMVKDSLKDDGRCRSQDRTNREPVDNQQIIIDIIEVCYPCYSGVSFGPDGDMHGDIW